MSDCELCEIHRFANWKLILYEKFLETIRVDFINKYLFTIILSNKLGYPKRIVRKNL